MRVATARFDFNTGWKPVLQTYGFHVVPSFKEVRNLLVVVWEIAERVCGLPHSDDTSFPEEHRQWLNRRIEMMMVPD